ncbi:MAG: CDP-diacylglycerol--glycerol-3-phosphate 3-phosphatidyltransferase [Bacilli bacterium]|jgi:CDP-diacylglycerol---glycerol-3-phosphate 3-phosphatidyltransferase|nr:CDP-diacylglycerol--glycerol-3-phosphate 3-phosphatidyltransferase [Bacilli bacterium]MDD3068799.1 CDP-diacylglycerol--glycerol-3-phosphate 3-phosphatidyltransferase [Bacilli bacterium]MDD3841217.1 CDP-diacylglycerol--glycerol-3-phosphate 3-phosphatidyltransferase [Bacilli bacterium]
MNLPTKITITRIFAIALMIVALFVMSFFHFDTPKLGNTNINLVFLILCVFFLLASFTDFIDGYLARKNNQVTDLGKFLDPVADKLLVNSMVIFLIAPTLFAPYANEQILTFNMWCAIILIGRDIVVDALRFIAAQKKIVIAANIFGKAKTVLQMVAITFVLLNGFPFNYFDAGWPNGLHITDFIVYIATAVSLLSGIIYVIQNRQVFKDTKK